MPAKKHNPRRYRSGLEKVVAKFLKDKQKRLRYEDLKIDWKDLRYRTYTPDFVLDNGIIVETKGIFDSEDRRKHIAVREQHPETSGLYSVTLTLSCTREPRVRMQFGVRSTTLNMHTE